MGFLGNVAKTMMPEVPTTLAGAGGDQSVPRVSAQAMNQASAQQPPQTMFDFYNRGGLGATIDVATQQQAQKQGRAAMQKQYEDLLAKGEKAGDAIYSSAVKKYGDGIKEYIPPKDLYYDQKSGEFDGHEYAKHVFIGIEKFRKDQESGQDRQMKMDEVQSKKDQEQQTMFAGEKLAETVSGIPAGTSREGAMKTIAGDVATGYAPKQQVDAATKAFAPEMTFGQQASQSASLANLNR